MPSSAIRSGLLAAAVFAALSGAAGNAATAESVRPYRDGQITPPNRGEGRPLEGTYWKAIELLGTPTPAQDPKREAHLEFQPAGRVSGSDGCNRITGSYQLKGEAVAFSEIAGTRMACTDTGNVERAFHDALKTATRLTRVGDRMTLADAAGTRVAVFTAGTEARGSNSSTKKEPRP